MRAGSITRLRASLEKTGSVAIPASLFTKATNLAKAGIVCRDTLHLLASLRTPEVGPEVGKEASSPCFAYCKDD